MRFIASVVGLVVGCLLLASGAAHSLMGWPVQMAALQAAHAPNDLMSALAMGWHFAGMAMFVFGAIAAWTFVCRLRGQSVTLWPVWLIAAGYVAFGAVALIKAPGEPFFLFTFLLPGILLAAAAWPDPGARLAS